MKKIMIMMAVALISVCGCAQKKVVNTVKNKATSSEAPDFAGARDLIKGALVDPTTKDLANTWYVAGLIGYSEISYADIQKIYGKTPDQQALANAADESYDYWLVADSMSQVLVADKKGNMKPADPKVRKQIQEKMAEYYKDQWLMVKAFDLNGKEDYEGAYAATMKHLSIPTLAMMQEPKLQEKLVRDTTYYTYKYYAARFAYSAGHYADAEKLFTELYKEDKDAALTEDVIHALEYLCEIKKQAKDTTGYINQLKLGFELYPQEAWFVQNLINFYLQELKDEKGALEYVDQAIAADPQPQYYNLKGNLFLQASRFEEAREVFNYMLTLDANSADAYEGIGRSYYFSGDEVWSAAAYLNSNKECAAEQARAKSIYRQAIEPLEKVHQLTPTNRAVLNLLKNIYYKLEMWDENHNIVVELQNL